MNVSSATLTSLSNNSMATHKEAYPQQCLQRDEPHLHSVSPSFDDYSFAPPILRTSSFECDDDDSHEVWYTPPVEDREAIALIEKESKSLPVPTVSEELVCPAKLPASRSAPASPASSSAPTAKKNNRLKLNLPFKLNGLKSLTKSNNRSKFSKKGSKSDVSVSPISSSSSELNDLPPILNDGTEQTYTASSCDISITETEITQVFSNRTSRLVQEASVANDSFDDIQLNPFPQPTNYASSLDSVEFEQMTGGGLCGIGASEDEVELVLNDMSSVVESKTEPEIADYDAYYAGGSIDTVHGACGELGALAKALGTPSRKTVSTPVETSPNVVPNAMDTTGSSISSMGSASSHSSTSSSGILKPPKITIKGYDPFGVHTTDFVMPKQKVHFENIDEVENGGNFLLSDDGGSDSSSDSTSSLEYALRYFGCAGSISDSSYFV